MEPNSIVLTSEDVKNLNNFIQEIPTKYGIYLLNVLNQAINRANLSQESNTTIEKEESSKVVSK